MRERSSEGFMQNFLGSNFYKNLRIPGVWKGLSAFVVLACLIFAQSLTYAANAVGNPGAEANLNGWNTSGSASGTVLSRDTTVFHSGVASFKLAVPASATGDALLNDSPNWTLSSPSTSCSASAWVKGVSGTKARIRFREYTQGGSNVGTQYTEYTFADTDWHQISVTKTVTVGNSIDFNIFGYHYIGGQTFWADDITEDCSGAPPPPNTAPKAALKLTPTSGNYPLVVSADASASTDAENNISSYKFDFGDGSAVVGPQAASTTSHTYSSAGNYTVTVTVTDSGGLSSQTTQTLTVNTPPPPDAAPSAGLSVAPSSGTAPLDVTADASTSSDTDPTPIANYKFDFGDGSAAIGPQAGATATHTYTNSGTYTVTVTVTDTAGLSGTATKTVAVNTQPPPNTAPGAAITVTPSGGNAPLAVTADASASTDAENNISSYKFDFGDGSAAIGPQAGATATHTFSTAGNYTVTVTVTDSGGLSSQATQTIVVTTPPPPPPPPPPPTNTAPTASLTVNPATGNAPLNITADASASTDAENNISSYTFNFGDGTSVGPQTGALATHTYSNAGNYTLTVSVTDSGGLSSQATRSVTVNTPPPTTTYTITAAGDVCDSTSSTGCSSTALLIDQVNPDRVLTLGDNAYNDGTLANFTTYYQPTWGRFMPKTSPTPGNHDYHVANGADYFTYFGSRAPGPYYSYNLGNWHLISLDGEISVSAGSAQETWLKSDLSANAGKCIIAYWHEMRFSSGTVHSGSSSFSPFWQDLYSAKADVVLNAHNHQYERFAQQSPNAVADSKGIREFVVGTGGASESGYGFTNPPAANSEVRNSGTKGILRLTLKPGSYDWQFMPTAGSTFTDSGSNSCHNAATTVTTGSQSLFLQFTRI
jgi:PKD repeat protein